MSAEKVEEMLRSHPRGENEPVRAYAETIVAIARCAETCTICADACLAEEHVADLRRCIRTDQDCADVCYTTARLLARITETPHELVHAQLHACVVACQVCADECEKHAEMHEHCRRCAEVCHECQERCNFLLGEITASGTVPSNPLESPPLSE